MVSKVLPRHVLFSWSTNFDVDKDGNVTTIWFHDATDSYRIQPTAASITQAKNIIAQIKAWMNQTELWEGTVVEHWQLQNVTVEATTKKDWVKVT